VTRSVRFPFSFGQKVEHPSFTMPFVVVAQECDRLGDWTISVTDEKGGGWWRFPAHELVFASIVDEQAAMAEWMGCSVERMNRHHDDLHRWLSARAELPSYSLLLSEGANLTPDEHAVAAAEEDAVLYVQRYLCAVEQMGAPQMAVCLRDEGDLLP
jgi:hypothetical protein